MRAGFYLWVMLGRRSRSGGRSIIMSDLMEPWGTYLVGIFSSYGKRCMIEKITL
jgi:hypothetical protein